MASRPAGRAGSATRIAARSSLGFLLGLIATAAMTTVAMAQQAGATAPTRFEVHAGPLAPALADFAADAGVSLSAPPELVRGITSPGLSGSYAVPEGLARLLAGTGLEAVPSGDRAWLLRRKPAAEAPSSDATGSTLPEVRVTAQGPGNGTTEGTGSYAAGPSSSATGLSLSPRETPQTVTVVTRQQMDDQGSLNVSDVMERAPGITVQSYDSERWSFSARGFAVTNFQYDGVSKDYDGVYDWGATNGDMAIYDRVEIVKGATGLMSGTGDPSAAVNFIRKRPTQSFAGSVAASLGSWQSARTELDLSGPLNESGSVRGRFVGAYQDRESYLDHYRQKKSVAYGVIEADLSRDTLLTLGMDYQNTDPRGSTWTGFPIFFSDGSRTDWSRSFNPATTWSRRELETRNLFATLEHRLADDWRLKLTVNNQESKHRSLLGSASGGNPDPVTGEGMYLFSGDFRGNRTQDTANASITGSYALGGRKHDLMFGGMWSNTRTDGPWSESLYPLLPGSIFNWTGHFPQPEFPPIASYEDRDRQTAVYGATRLRPTDALSVILGARVTRVTASDTRTYVDGMTPPLSSSLSESGVTTPYAGVVFDLDPTWSVYASYTSIFSPQSLMDVNRQYLPPIEGRGVEAGIKGEFLDGRLNASLAAFQIKQDNVAEYVDFVDGESVYRAVQGVTSRGIEAELNGQIAPGWNLQAGYTYNHVRDAEGERVYGATLMASQPAQMLRLSTSYRLPGAWQKLTIGGGVSWQSAFYGKVWNPAAGDYAIIEQKPYALVALMARYEFSKQLSATLNINNLFDKKYYAGLGLFETGFYGAPRNAMLTMRYQF
ncbi:TonB-dependent siderophore receptor [Variovorax saccharolyticus]|uniref:TonB-dependent siderophore receptor n=1 Tax=Variovorax saccharolyticus TaxID=3053516 RepID=UPI0025750487|nr:TonB-dependent receptor [Variovorax sp. J22R187]MDM0019341.1 TonB-dependent siderophore receptor [Variovorax sp. J22R187]